jgi:hypothetical protein
MTAEVPARRRLTEVMDDRRADLRLQWRDVAKRAAISPTHLRRIRNITTPLNKLLKASLEDALEWRRGSIETVLNGGDPTPLGSDDRAGPAELTATSGMTAEASVTADLPDWIDMSEPGEARLWTIGRQEGYSEGVIHGAVLSRREHLEKLLKTFTQPDETG